MVVIRRATDSPSWQHDEEVHGDMTWKLIVFSMVWMDRRPALVIMDTSNTPPGMGTTSEKQRDAEFLDLITTTLRKGGNVLVPVDTTGRVQELLLMLNNHWNSDKLLWGYKIILLHHMAANIIHFTKCMIEWMHHDVIRTFDRNLRNPFNLRHVFTAHSVADVDSILTGEYGTSPGVILASDKMMDYGFSKALMVRWASRPENALVIVDPQCREGSVAAQMLQRPVVLQTQLPVIEKLEGEELASYREKTEREQRKAVEQEEFRRQAQELVVGTMAVSFSDELEDTGMNDKPKPLVKTYSRKRQRTLTHYSKPRFLMFGFYEPEKQVEEYGIPLLEGECTDTTKFNFQQQKGRLQGLGGNAASTKGSQLERWGYFESIFMTETEAQIRAAQKDTTGEGVPIKITMKDRSIDVRWQIKAINLDGRADSRNRRAILSLLAPRRVILVHGLPDATEDLRSHAAKISEVLIPSDGEVVEVSLDTKMFDIAMDQALVTNLRTKHVGDYEVSFLDAEVGGGDSAPLSGSMSVSTEDVHVLRRRSDAGPRSHAPVLISLGDVLLTDETMQKELEDAGVTVEFRVDSEGARLTCNGKVVIRRTKDSGISLEGPLSDDYFKVRKVVYSRFTTV